MWRPGKGNRRICVGIISVLKNGEGISFKYSPEGVESARKVDSNFNGYPGLPISSNAFPSERVSEVLFGRLINNTRNDVSDFYNFWLVDQSRINDQLYILAQTQGLSATDMFEFVPQYFNSHRPSFITDIAGISQCGFDLSLLKISDNLSFTQEKDNEFDSNAVYVSFKGKKIGYIKKGHNMVFGKKSSKNITLTVWSITNVPGFQKLYVKVDIK